MRRASRTTARMNRFIAAVRAADAGSDCMKPYDLPDATRPLRPVRRHLRRRNADPCARRVARCLREVPARSGLRRRVPARTQALRRPPEPDLSRAALERELGGAQIYLKREDLNHTGAHKINNTIGQALLARRMGKPRVIAETGAGQHGVATATVARATAWNASSTWAARTSKRQAPNVYRMKLLGRRGGAGRERLAHAEGRAERGDARLGDERREHVLHHRHGRRPASVSDDGARLPSRHRRGMPVADAGADRAPAGRGDRLRRRRQQRDGHLLRLHPAREGAPDRRRGRGRRTDDERHAASLQCGTPGVLHGNRTYLLQDENGQIIETHSVSAGLDYPGVGPEHAWLKDSGRAEYVGVTDDEALKAFHDCCRIEGIIPALESSHALAYAMKLAPTLPKDQRAAGESVGPRRQGPAHRRRGERAEFYCRASCREATLAYGATPEAH